MMKNKFSANQLLCYKMTAGDALSITKIGIFNSFPIAHPSLVHTSIIILRVHNNIATGKYAKKKQTEKPYSVVCDFCAVQLHLHCHSLCHSCCLWGSHSLSGYMSSHCPKSSFSLLSLLSQPHFLLAWLPSFFLSTAPCPIPFLAPLCFSSIIILSDDLGPCWPLLLFSSIQQNFPAYSAFFIYWYKKYIDWRY